MSNEILGPTTGGEEVAFEELITQLADCAGKARERLEPRAVFDAFMGIAIEVGLQSGNRSAVVLTWVAEMTQALKQMDRRFRTRQWAQSRSTGRP